MSVRINSKSREEVERSFYTHSLARAIAWKTPANVLEQHEVVLPSF